MGSKAKNLRTADYLGRNPAVADLRPVRAMCVRRAARTVVGVDADPRARQALISTSLQNVQQPSSDIHHVLPVSYRLAAINLLHPKH